MSKDGDNNEPSIDDIVASIRRIISDEETKTRRPPPPAAAAKTEDILELTNMLNDDGTVTPLPRPAPPVDAPQPVMPFADPEEEAPIYAAPKPPEGPRIINRPPPLRMSPEDRLPGPTTAPPPPAPDVIVQPQPSPPPVTRVAAPMSNNNAMTGSGVTLTPVNQANPAGAPGNAPAAPPPAGNQPVPNLASPQTVGAAASAFDRLTQAALQQNAPPAPPPRPAGPPIGGKSVEDLTREMLRPMLQQWIDANLPSMVERLVQQEIQRLARR